MVNIGTNDEILYFFIIEELIFLLLIEKVLLDIGIDKLTA